MVFNKFRVETESGIESELCLGSDLLDKIQKSVKIEQKVAQLFESLREPVYHYLMAVFGNAAEAEDITQETFLQLYRSLDGGVVIENARPWIFRVAHNLAINVRKHNQFFNPLDDRTWDDIALSLPDNALNPEQSLLQQEKYTRLHAAIGRLTLPERQCLHLRAEGFRYREIAEILGVATPTVGEYLRRGIKKLMVQNDE